MTSIQHHIPDNLLLAYASGNLSHPLAVAVASHVSMCDECRAALETHQAIGGELIESSPDEAVSSDLRSRVLAQLDLQDEPIPEYHRSGVYPAPVMEALKGQQPRWKKLGAGVRQCILSHQAEGSVRLLQIPPGVAVPDHGHSGLELTLVLQGSFRDETGHFGVGDIEVADDDIEHTPVAGEGSPCICLAATESALRFNAFLPRLLQPIFRI